MAKPRTTGRSLAKATRAGKAKAKPKPKPQAQAKPRAKITPKPKRHAKPKPKTHASGANGHHAERFERQAYEVPVLDLGEAIALATALVAARPGKASPVIVEEAKRVSAARDHARAVQATHGNGQSVDARAYDASMDRAWETFVRRIQDHVELPGPRVGADADALGIFKIVSDLSILKLNYLAEFAQIGARLDALKREGLLDVAAQLAGPVFLEEVLRCHGEYGQALGLMPDATPDEAVVDRGEARNALVEAIHEYAVQVMAHARAGRHESWAPVAKALAPIADLRARKAQTQHAQPPAAVPVHPPIERAES